MSLLNKVMDLDIQSEEWNDIYNAVVERHWNTKPAVEDDYFRAGKVLAILITRDAPDLIIATAKIAEQVLYIQSGKTDAVTAELHIGKHKMYFKVATSRDAIDNLHKQLANTVVMKAKEGAPND